MPTMTTRPRENSTPPTTLLVAFDLGNTEWTLASSPTVAETPRVRTLPARNLPRLVAEFAAARHHFGLAATAPIQTCYEAGRDGFWLHRALASAGIPNVVVDSASIEVTRRAGRAKTDRLDATRCSDRCCAIRRARRAYGGSCTCRPWQKKTGATPTANSRGSPASTRAASIRSRGCWRAMASA